MPKIDRRKFALGLVVMPLAGCSASNTAPFVPAEPPIDAPPIFRNYGYWHNSSTYVATGNVRP